MPLHQEDIKLLKQLSQYRGKLITGTKTYLSLKHGSFLDRKLHIFDQIINAIIEARKQPNYFELAHKAMAALAIFAKEDPLWYDKLTTMQKDGYPPQKAIAKQIVSSLHVPNSYNAKFNHFPYEALEAAFFLPSIYDRREKLELLQQMRIKLNTDTVRETQHKGKDNKMHYTYTLGRMRQLNLKYSAANLCARLSKLIAPQLILNSILQRYHPDAPKHSRPWYHALLRLFGIHTQRQAHKKIFFMQLNKEMNCPKYTRENNPLTAQEAFNTVKDHNSKPNADRSTQFAWEEVVKGGRFFGTNKTMETLNSLGIEHNPLKPKRYKS